jgi:hypothetical protein
LNRKKRLLFPSLPGTNRATLVSSPGEFHPQALSEPDLRLSPHPAPIIQPLGALFWPLVPPLLPRLTAGQNWITQSLRSTSITEASSLLRIVPPLLIASILSSLRVCHLEFFFLTSRSRFPSSIEKPVLGSCQLYTGHRLVSKQGLFQTHLRLAVQT